MANRTARELTWIEREVLAPEDRGCIHGKGSNGCGAKQFTCPVCGQDVGWPRPCGNQANHTGVLDQHASRCWPRQRRR